MREGDRVSYKGRAGTVVGFMPQGMVDIKFDDAAHRIERRSKADLTKLTALVARKNSGEDPRKDKAREAERLRQAKSEVARSYRTIGKSQRKIDADVAGAIKSPKGAIFTRPDPPRMSRDRKGYCGNPIDSTAYYLVVDNSRGWTPVWVTWAAVAQAAQAEGLQFEGPPQPLVRKMSRTQVLQHYLDTWVVPALSGYLASHPMNPPPLEGEFKDMYLGLARIMIDGELVKQGADWTETQVPKGAELVISVPSYGQIVGLSSFFRETYKEQIDARSGQEVYPVTIGFSQYIRQRGGKYRQKGLTKDQLIAQKKVGAAGAEPVLGTDFSTFDPETGRITFWRVSKSKSPGKDRLRMFEAFAFRNYRLPPESSLPANAVSEWGSLAVGLSVAARLAGDTIAYETASWLITAGYVKVADSGRGKPVITPFPKKYVAGAKIMVSGADRARNPFFSWVPTTVPLNVVQAQTENLTVGSSDDVRRLDSEIRALRRQMSEIGSYIGQTDDDQEQSALKAKAKKLGARFSALKAERKEARRAARKEFAQDKRGLGPLWAPCLTEEDEQLQRVLKVAKQILQRYQNALGKARVLFRKVALDPSAYREENPSDSTWRGKSDVRKVMDGLASAYASFMRWWLKIQRQAAAGDNLSRQVIQTMLSTSLRLDDPNSIFSRAISLYHAGEPTWEKDDQGRLRPVQIPSLLSVVPTSVEDDLYAAEQRKKKGRRYRDDGGVQASLGSRSQYRKFMNYLGMLFDQREGDAEVPAQSLIQSGTAIQIPVSIRRPGRTAYRWLLGDDSNHPYLDLFFYVYDSLGARQRDHLHKKMNKVYPPAIYELRETRPASRAGTLSFHQILNKESRPDLYRAYWLKQMLGAYAIGGVYRDGEFRDPTDTNYPYQLDPPPNWPVSGAEQMDANWAIVTTVTDVYEALVWDRKLPVEQARREAADLLLLARFYDDLGGYQLVGPLNPTVDAAPGILSAAISEINAAILETMGGEVGLSSTGNFTVYKTYNPVLFQVTRLFWPTPSAEDKSWHGVLGAPDVLADLDTVGRFGYAAAITQQVAMTSSSEEQVQQKIQQFAGAYSGQKISSILTNTWVNDDGEVFEVEPRVYTPFRMMWPINVPLLPSLGGQASQDANVGIVTWMHSPLDYLASIKAQVGPAVARLSGLGTFGYQRGRLLTQGPGSEVINDILEGVVPPLDPRVPEPRDASGRAFPGRERELAARSRLRDALDPELLGEPDLARRAKAEAKKLAEFQRTPGRVKRYAEGGRARTFPIPSPGESGLYDAATIHALELRQRSGSIPPGLQEGKGGHKGIPFILTQQAEIRTPQGMMYVGQKPIYDGDPVRGLPPSVLQQIEAERDELGENISMLEDAIKKLKRMRKK